MDITVLKQVGIDTDSAVERFMGKETIYVKMLKKFLDDRTYEKLINAISENNQKSALESSHTIKGISGNLSMNTLFELFSRQVVLMRADKWAEAYEMMTEINENYKKFTEKLTGLFEAEQKN